MIIAYFRKTTYFCKNDRINHQSKQLDMKETFFMRSYVLLLTTVLVAISFAQTSKFLDLKELAPSNGKTVWLKESHTHPKDVERLWR